MNTTRQRRWLQHHVREQIESSLHVLLALCATACLPGCGDAGEESQSSARGGIGGRAQPAVSSVNGRGGSGTSCTLGGNTATSASQGASAAASMSNGGTPVSIGGASSGNPNQSGGTSIRNPNQGGSPSSANDQHQGGAAVSTSKSLGQGGSVGVGGSIAAGGAVLGTSTSAIEMGGAGVGGRPAVGGETGLGGVFATAGATNVGEQAGSAGTATNQPSAGQKTCDGYTLLGMPSMSGGQPSPARLIDMKGQLVHTWTIGGFPPKMLPGGSLIGCVGVIGTYDCAELQQVTWDGVLEWSFSNWVNPSGTPVSRQHHDLQREGNPVGFYAPGQDFVSQGKTLVLAHQGRSVPSVRDKLILDDVIYEVNWAGEVTGDFKWFAADHIDQFGFDESARSHIRTTSPNTSLLEWLHGNSVSRLGPNHWFDEGHTEFHPDNIIYSSRDASFVVILSHETGDVVWRIGPDFAGRPEEKLGQFAGQHHAHLIPARLPGAGNILVFDNGGASGYGGTTPPTAAPTRYSRQYSRVLEFNPITMDIVWQYGTGTDNENFYSQLISSAQRLPNGNTLIAIGQKGQVLEVTPDKQIVWDYQQTSETGAAAPTYRAYRIPPEWLPAGVNEALGNYPSWFSRFPTNS